MGMRFEPTGIEGLLLIHVERHGDDRGSFGRTFCREEFQARGLPGEFIQASSSRTWRAGTVRGMHLQRPPHMEAKLIRCVRGTIHDVICDLRPHSTTCLCQRAFRLHQDDDCLLFVPTGCAHGFQTLTDDVEVLYSMSHTFAPEAATGLRHDDPALAITWPAPVTCIADKDLRWPAYDSANFSNCQPPPCQRAG